MLSKPTTPQTTAEPDRGDIQRLAADALQALKAVREQLNRETEAIRAERQQIEVDRQTLLAEKADLQSQHQAHEAELARINELAAKLERQQAEVDQSIAELETQKNGVVAEREGLARAHEHLNKERQAHMSAARAQSEREAAFQQTHAQVEALAQSLVPRQAAIEQEEARLVAHREQLEAYASELEETRTALVTMQTQLAHEQQELVSQRGEILQRFADLPKLGGAPNLNGNGKTSLPPPPIMERPGSPKPAANVSADQFRKLRRDAKRRAIGV